MGSGAAVGRRRTGGVTRRSSRQALLVALLLCTAAFGFAALCTFLRAPDAGSVVYVPGELLPPADDPPLYVAAGRFYVVHLKAGEAPVSGRYGPPAVTPGGYLALPARERLNSCSQRGIEWVSSFRQPEIEGAFMDPCRHAAFNRAGLDFYGPAWRPMSTLGASFDSSGNLRVDTRAIRPGAADNPLRAVRP